MLLFFFYFSVYSQNSRTNHTIRPRWFRKWHPFSFSTSKSTRNWHKIGFFFNLFWQFLSFSPKNPLFWSRIRKKLPAFCCTFHGLQSDVWHVGVNMPLKVCNTSEVSDVKIDFSKVHIYARNGAHFTQNLVLIQSMLFILAFRIIFSLIGQW